MAPKRRRNNANDDEVQENITWVSQQIDTGTLILLSVVALLQNSAFVDLDDERQPGREHLNKRIEAYGLKIAQPAPSHAQEEKLATRP